MRQGGRRSWPTCGVLASMALLTACAGNGPQRAPQAANSQGSPAVAAGEPRSERGNPPFYDVLGKRYHVLSTSADYRQRGVASWYGRDFHGLATSSGETYDMHAMTAAHTTLPIPTWVEVTNLSNGKRVNVRVNDRGPFVDNRLIDLSYAAATALDMVRSGTTRVEVRAIAAPGTAVGIPPQITTAAAPSVPATVMGLPRPIVPPTVAVPPVVPAEKMFVQVGAFTQRDNAARLVERLRASGFVNPLVFSDSANGRTLHRVRLGPILDSQEFDQLSARLRGMGVTGARLVVAR